MQVTIKPGRMVDGQFVPYEPPGPVTPWWWQVDDDEAVYSGSCPTETEAWCQASVALGWAPPPMVARIEGVTAGLNAIRARAEAAEARVAQSEADARLMLAVVYEIGVDLSVDIVMSMADHGLTDEERIACGDLVATHAGAGPDALLAIMRRILAAAGST